VQRVGDVARVDDRHDEHGAEAAHELRDPVRNDVARREPTCDRDAGGDRRVEVAAGEVPEGRDRERDAEAEPRGDAQGGDRVAADVDEDGHSAEAEEEEEERSECFRAEAHAERLIHGETSVGVAARFAARRRSPSRATMRP
jgi:hypothetical protein